MQDIENGLSEQEVIMSRERFGENKLREYKRKSFFKCFLSNLGDPIIKVLIGALFINVIFMFPRINWFESGGILCSIIIATLVSTFSEYSSENTFEKLRNQSENITAVVKRAGGVCEINSQEVVVGDIYTVSAGNMVVADGIIIDGQLHLDESALSGESREVIKSKGEKIYKGSLALGGGCDTRVEAVGEGTYYGRIARELKCDSRPSPLKNRLSHLAKSISRLGYLLAGLIAIAYLFNVFFIDTGFDMSKTVQLAGDIKFLLSKLLYALTLAVSIVVVAVPEGLPMMITVVLSSNMKRMMQDNVLVKRLVGIETSGNINLLFTDKTGTLTEGKLRVKELIGAQGISFGSLSALKNAPNYRKYVTLCASFCNEAKISKGKAVGSDATDRCLKEYFKDEKISARVIDRQSFDSAKKYSSATVEWQDERVVLYKGAPEKLLTWSNKYLTKEGITLPFDKKTRTELEGRLCDLGSRAYRVVALAYENGADVVFVALVAIRDRIRKEVPRAVAEVQGAGIGVVMITGDNESTAEAIAKECGIISPQTQRSLVLNGAYLEKITDEELTELMPKIAVIARALPSDKSRLVRLAQNLGYVVGMTGDGINDAPSLKSADVGFGMGSGTEVAKEACDIVISNNNFASIVKAILYGRTIFESIRKFIVFQLIMNFAAVGISLLGPFIGVDNPVTVTQMLWVNIIMDTLGALAFAREPHLKEYMKQKPRSSTEQIISKRMVEQIALTAAYVLILCIWFLKSDTLPLILLKGDDRYILSAFFAMFIFTGVFTCFTARTTRLNIFAGIGKNKSFLAIMLSISIVQMAFIYFGGDTFRATPLYLSDLFKVILISFTVVIFDLLRKIGFKLLRKKNKGENKCY